MLSLFSLETLNVRRANILTLMLDAVKCHKVSIHVFSLIFVKNLWWVRCEHDLVQFYRGDWSTNFHFYWLCWWYLTHLIPFKRNIFTVFCDFLTCCSSLSDTWREKRKYKHDNMRSLNCLQSAQTLVGVARLSFHVTYSPVCPVYFQGNSRNTQALHSAKRNVNCAMPNQLAHIIVNRVFLMARHCTSHKTVSFHLGATCTAFS